MLRFIPLVFILLISNSAVAQCENDRYRNFIFGEIQVETDVLYGNNVNFNNEAQDLFLDVYSPVGDTESARALIIIAHGGSFVGGSKDGDDVVPFCEDFAKMGYVVASIQYRLGITPSFDLEQPATEAVLRGVHDGRAAVRFFRKDVEENGNNYGIDPDQIYMAGVSAGGFIALHMAYMDELDEFPAAADTTISGLGGGIEGLSGNPGFSSDVNAIINIAGALISTETMNSGDEPICSFHGNFDATVPFGTDMLQLVLPVTVVDGSETVHHAADSLGILNCFEIQEDQGHVPHVSNAAYYDTLRSISANFLSHLICPDLYALDCDYRELETISSIEETALSSFGMIPNPTSDVFVLQLEEGMLNGSTTVEIIDITGRTVQSERIIRREQSISLPSLPSGIYIVQLSWEDQILSQRLVKK